jgi:hypothetical protein
MSNIIDKLLRVSDAARDAILSSRCLHVSVNMVAAFAVLEVSGGST